MAKHNKLYIKEDVDKSEIYKTFDGTKESLNKILNELGISREELTEFEIPYGVTSIDENAFKNCIGLTYIAIPDSVKIINNFAFEGCVGLENIKIGNNVKRICYQTFYECSNLINVELPNSVTDIGVYAFEYCSNLTSITIPKSVIDIGGYAFSHCDNLTIKCSKNSYAYKYAQKNNIPVKLIDETTTEESLVKEDWKRLQADKDSNIFKAYNQFNYDVLGLIINDETKQFQIVPPQLSPIGKYKRVSKSWIRKKAQELLDNGYTEFKGESSENKFEESNVNEGAGYKMNDIDNYQKWVDYDMKHYGRISDQTNKEIKEAGLQVVKDKYGDYEVIAGKYGESLKLKEAEESDNSQKYVDDTDKFFHIAFRVLKKVIFEVNYYRLGHNANPYFSTSAGILNRNRTDWDIGGQAQDDVLPKSSYAYKFYKKWDEYHLKPLTEEQYSEMISDLSTLKTHYPYIESDRDVSFYDIVKMDRNPIKEKEPTDESLKLKVSKNVEIKKESLLKEGPGAGYSIESEVKITSIDNIKLGEETTIFDSYKGRKFTCNGKAILKEISANSYYYGDTVKGDFECEFSEGVIDTEYFETEEEMISAIQDLVGETINFSIVYGGGWVHSTYDGTLSEDETSVIRDYNSSNFYYGDVYITDLKVIDTKLINYIDKTVSGDSSYDWYEVWDDIDFVEGFESEEEAREFAKNDYSIKEIRHYWGKEDIDGDLLDVDYEIIWNREPLDDEDDIEESLSNGNEEQASSDDLSFDIVQWAYDEFPDMDYFDDNTLANGDVILRFSNPKGKHDDLTKYDDFIKALKSKFGDRVETSFGHYRYAPEIKHLAVKVKA